MPGSPAPFADLLHAEPRPAADNDSLRAAVRFAFETGDASGVVAAAMAKAPPTHTQWAVADFEPQLFLTDLVRTCFPIQRDASNGAGSEPLRAILLRPPANLSDTIFRQQIFRELETSPDLHDALVRVHGLLCSLRAMLDEGHRAQYDTVQHKIDILTSYAELVDTLAGRFESAQSGLQRLARLGAAIQATDGHTLLRRMLDYEGHVGTVDVRLRMGADGRVRDLSLLAVRDNRDNPLVPSLLQRIVRWLQVVILRGYRMGGREVIVRLVGDVFSAVEPDLVRCLLLLGPASFYLAGLGFRDLARAKGLEVCLPTFAQAPRLDGDTGAPRTLRKLFNPLLLLQGTVPTPCDLGPTPCDSITVLTGPNSGGKTRVLQAAALAQLLGQAGLYVPAAEAHLVWAPTMVVSLANEATAAQREGRLGAELSRIRHVFEQIQPGSLVVLDELCEGTNPSEGEALFGLVTTLLPALRPQVLVTTHFLDFAARLCRDRPVPQLEFLQVELGPDNLPTFQFVPGVATTSLARHVAQRVGVTREQLEGLIARRRHELQRRGA